MESLNIAIYSDTYLPARDGVVTYIQTLRRELERLGHNIYVVTVSCDRDRFQRVDEKVIYAYGHRLARYPQYTISYFPFKVNKPLLGMGIDIIHAQTPFSMGYSGLRLSSLGSIPAVATFHSLVFDRTVLSAFLPDNARTVTTAQKAMLRYLRWHYSKFSALISPSDFIKRTLMAEGIREPVTIPNGVDIASYKSDVSVQEARTNLGIGPDDRVVLFLGRISREKNLDVLIRAASLCPKEKFFIVGSGPQIDYYKSIAASLGLTNVYFTGFVEDKLVPLYLKSADLFCNPSNYEVLSTVDIEAMAAGTPILVPSDTSQEELTFGGSAGRTFQNSDSDDLARQILGMLDESSLFNPSKYAELFSPAKHARKLLNLYSKVEVS